MAPCSLSLSSVLCSLCAVFCFFSSSHSQLSSLFFFFLMIRPPPSSPLFPYPTLSRSLIDVSPPPPRGAGVEVKPLFPPLALQAPVAATVMSATPKQAYVKPLIRILLPHCV